MKTIIDYVGTAAISMGLGAAIALGLIMRAIIIPDVKVERCRTYIYTERGEIKDSMVVCK